MYDLSWNHLYLMLKFLFPNFSEFSFFLNLLYILSYILFYIHLDFLLKNMQHQNYQISRLRTISAHRYMTILSTTDSCLKRCLWKQTILHGSLHFRCCLTREAILLNNFWISICPLFSCTQSSVHSRVGPQSTRLYQ